MEFQGFRNRKMIYNLWVFRISMLIYWIEIRFTGKKVSIDSFTIIISSFTPTISWLINVNHPFPNSDHELRCPSAQVALELLQPGPELRFHRAEGELHHPTRQFQRQFAC